MRVREAFAGFCAAILCAATSVAGTLPTTPPTGTVHIDGQSYPMTFERDVDSGLWGFNFSRNEANQYQVSLTGAVDPDPSIGYALAVTDFGAPSTFGFSILAPIVPVGSPTEVIASIDGGLLDFTGNGISLTPTLSDAIGSGGDGDGLAEVQIAKAGSPGLVNMGVDVGGAISYGVATPAPVPYTYGPYSEPIQPGPGPGTFTMLSVDVGFMLSGAGDIAALTGHAEIAEEGGIVPEPSALALGGCALAVLGLLRWRRRSR